jgi:hypothetical protein
MVLLESGRFFLITKIDVHLFYITVEHDETWGSGAVIDKGIKLDERVCALISSGLP